MTARTTLPALIAEEPLTPQPPVLVLFGRDRAGKPRAAWFDGNQAKAALAAADTMKLRALPLMGDEQRVLAAELAHGRILPSGKAHVPGARRDLYGRLVTLAGDSAGLSITDRSEERGEQSREPIALPCAAPATAKGAETEPSLDRAAAPLIADVPKAILAIAMAEPSSKLRPGDGLFVGEVKPTTREQIGLGSIVLAQEGPDEGWWEAEVIGCNGQVFSLRWQGYDPVTFATILRKPNELALLPLG